jgi:hypothetical protein
MFLVRRAAGVAKLKDVPRPDAFSVITTRKASHPKGRSAAEQRACAFDCLSMVISLKVGAGENSDITLLLNIPGCGGRALAHLKSCALLQRAPLSLQEKLPRSLRGSVYTHGICELKLIHSLCVLK